MNTKRVNAAADVIARAMENGRRVPAAIAVALESTQMLMSPEVAAELEQLRARVAELEAERHSTNEALADVTVALRTPQAPPAPTRVVEEDVTPQVQKLRSLLAGQRTAAEGEHYTSVHHSYRLGRDLPPIGGAL